MSSSCTTENAEKIYELARNHELIQRDMKRALELYEESADQNYLKAVLRLLNYYRVEDKKCPEKLQSFLCLYRNLCPSGPIASFDRSFHSEIENDSKQSQEEEDSDNPWTQVLRFEPPSSSPPRRFFPQDESEGEDESLSNEEEDRRAITSEEDLEEYIVSRNFNSS
jgi:TPR repeat protein